MDKNQRDQKKTPLIKETDRKRGRELLALFVEFFKIGLFTIGGGLAMIPLLEQVAVKKKKWLKEEEMMDCLAVSQSLPGVVAINMATYVGKKRAGIPGALAATVGVVLPSFIIIIAISEILLRVGDNKYVAGAFIGIKAAVCGMIAATVLRLGKKNLQSAFGWSIALAAFIAIAFFNISAVYAILGAALLGVLYQASWGRRKTEKPGQVEAEDLTTAKVGAKDASPQAEGGELLAKDQAERRTKK